MNVAVIFPGQGAQAPGMGLELAQAYPATAGAVFRAADGVLGYRLGRLIAAGDQRLLARTELTQPALLAASLAAWRALRAELPRLEPACAAGLSLGEYSALAAAEAVDLAEVFRLVSWRGRYMEEAARATPGGMSAVLGLERSAVESICAGTTDAGFGQVWVTNYNAPGQNVIAGVVTAVTEASSRVVASGGKVVPLKVNGAYHSPLMTAARQRLAAILATTPWRTPLFPVYSNVTARPHRGVADIVLGLAAQVTSAVLWEDIVRDMGARGIETFVELGPGKTLAALVGRILPGARVLNVYDQASLRQAVAALGHYALGVVS
ncbi:MAG: ACP S-malonyltransferase [Bacillota bacterium]|nr:MAG: ACP S-malonyltransferase [Bacillota bacterium]